MLKKRKVVPGIDVFFKKYIKKFRGKNIALISNYASVNTDLESTIYLLNNVRHLNIKLLLAPEHGIYGNFQAGENVPDYKDKKTGLPVISLYNQRSDKLSDLPNDIDERMRNFDTSSDGKKIDPIILKDIDLIILDLQDIGTRIYTYISTMGYLMEVLKSTGKELLILDRPNPITGTRFEGPILQYPKYSSFVGFYSIPVRHGLTIGELALFFNEKIFSNKVDLTLIHSHNWHREMWFDDTGTNWVSPSPNIPSLQSAIVYPGMVFLEGTNISEGRGTTQPFEIFGAPWIDGIKLTEILNRKQLKGVVFREKYFIPTFSKYSGEKCSGVQIFVTDRDIFSPFVSMLHILTTIHQLYPEKVVFHKNYFNKIMGTPKILKMIESGTNVSEITETYKNELDDYIKDIKRFYVYK